MPLKQVIKDEQGNFVQLANVSGTNNASSENIDLSEINSKIEAVEETANNALPKTGGEMTGSINLKASHFDVTNVPEGAGIASVYYHDMNNVLMGYNNMYKRSDGALLNSLVVTVRDADNNSITSVVCAGFDDQLRRFGSSAHPRADNYGTDIVTTQYAINKFLQRIGNYKEFHVGGSNKSDTANLYVGRGESADMPFASLDACLTYIRSAVGGGSFVTVFIHEDVNLNIPYLDALRFPQIAYLILCSPENEKHILTLQRNLYLQSGCIYLNNIKITGNLPSSSMFISDGITGFSSIVFNEGVEINGSAQATVEARNGGTIVINSNITGSVTGKKYNINNCSRLITHGKSGDFMPGTEAGTKDSSSIIS